MTIRREDIELVFLLAVDTICRTDGPGFGGITPFSQSAASL